MSDPIDNKLLFLCTGNYYCSRFCEHLFNAVAKQKELNWQADSRGLAVKRGVNNNNIGAISENAVRGLQQRGVTVPTDERFPRQALIEDFEAAFQIIALDESEHRPLIETRFPKWIHAVEYWDVHDIGGTLTTIAMEQMAQRISKLIQTLEIIAD
jgi:protein-tyrosine phosphatase